MEVRDSEDRVRRTRLGRPAFESAAAKAGAEEGVRMPSIPNFENLKRRRGSDARDCETGGCRAPAGKAAFTFASALH